ncbi:MAG: hypothetical protein M3Q60_19390 [Actinomycetota bacterium]|nr:hypothetical protein [Actinomycetota bacterium]
MTGLMDLVAAGIGLISAFLEVGTAVLMAWLAARRLGEVGRSRAREECVAREEATPLRRFARWTPRRRPGRRYERYRR